eukprot:CAMPEP_0172479298 /NCGR_PEP_ID=MMETSP1066-20121228/3842_1 /TAXON_ID=671091 /ORGANISM="Coscinodiscus wailesii, Strain CCMP2513" /LENGTH=243 /DNA_ID=CAMNT_0013239671 /DNA_START=298 /DNA_END=1030 /DNA_ORIENTATION=-
MALAILKHHAPSSSDNYGAEWWLQTRPEGVDIHYDKDETLAETFGPGSFPYVSTVTYMTSEGGPPTLVFDRCYADNDDVDAIKRVWMSHPRAGKYLAFDGRFLHGAPSVFSEGGGRERVTFLVNIWETKPAGVAPLTNDIRNQLGMVVDEAGLKLEERQISQCSLQKENVANTQRIMLPFVSKGATWIDDDIDEGMVLSIFPLQFDKEKIIQFELGDGVEAYLTYDNENKKEKASEKMASEDL